MTETVENMISTMAVLAPPSVEYNCHGWSFGTVRNIPLETNKKNLLNEINLYRGMKDYQVHTDETMQSLFSIPKNILTESSEPSDKEGSIIAYYSKEQTIAHTAKYLKSVKWYTYEDKYHKEWYDKDKQAVKFDESNNCIVERYTSKLGSGHLVTHDPTDIVFLYGEIGEYYDLTEGG